MGNDSSIEASNDEVVLISKLFLERLEGKIEAEAVSKKYTEEELQEAYNNGKNEAIYELEEDLVTNASDLKTQIKNFDFLLKNGIPIEEPTKEEINQYEIEISNKLISISDTPLSNENNIREIFDCLGREEEIKNCSNIINQYINISE